MGVGLVVIFGLGVGVRRRASASARATARESVSVSIVVSVSALTWVWCDRWDWGRLGRQIGCRCERRLGSQSGRQIGMAMRVPNVEERGVIHVAATLSMSYYYQRVIQKLTDESRI
jgi:hypothetical protein